jgi:hypothetical protein
VIRFLRWLTWTRWRLRHGSRFWAYLAVGGSVVHAVVRRLREPDARTTLELQPGDAIEVRVVDPEPR